MNSSWKDFLHKSDNQIEKKKSSPGDKTILVANIASYQFQYDLLATPFRTPFDVIPSKETASNEVRSLCAELTAGCHVIYMDHCPYLSSTWNLDSWLLFEETRIKRYKIHQRARYVLQEERSCCQQPHAYYPWKGQRQRQWLKFPHDWFALGTGDTSIRQRWFIRSCCHTTSKGWDLHRWYCSSWRSRRCRQPRQKTSIHSRSSPWKIRPFVTFRKRPTWKQTLEAQMKSRLKSARTRIRRRTQWRRTTSGEGVACMRATKGSRTKSRRRLPNTNPKRIISAHPDLNCPNTTTFQLLASILFEQVALQFIFWA